MAAMGILTSWIIRMVWTRNVKTVVLLERKGFEEESLRIYVLGIMFKADSEVCGEILGITPTAYRQRLSRIRRKVQSF